MDGRSTNGSAAFRAKVRDISEFLAEAGIRTEGLRPVPLSVTYHEPCHLVHGQGLSGPPRQVIGKIPGVELREMKESSWCCGMAGSFALKELETSRKLIETEARPRQGHRRRRPRHGQPRLSPAARLGPP